MKFLIFAAGLAAGAGAVVLLSPNLQTGCCEVVRNGLKDKARGLFS